MPRDDGALSRPTTRRAVVAAGAKLAYAAPLVAASMPLTAGGAAAVSGGVVCPAGLLQTISGRVTDAATGDPIAGAFLDFPGSEVGSEVFADDDGNYVTHCVSPTCCGYDVSSAGYQTVFGQVADLGLTEGATIDFQLDPAP